MSEDCIVKIKKLLIRDFSGWDGLAENCPLDSVKNLIPSVSSTPVTGLLGAQKIALQYYLGTNAEFSVPIQVWSEEYEVIKIDFRFPDINHSPNYFIDLFGEPEAKVDYYFNQVCFPQAEWIYASRGIVLRLNGDLSKVIKISVFHPMSVIEYENNVREFEYYREFRD